jgi:pSer/pThr/pTyr-binding forkhead associated (FHA) protein
MKDERTLVKINPVPAWTSELSKTRPISKRVVLEDLTSRHLASLEIFFPGVEPTLVELDDQETTIGRTSDCRIQLQLSNVSRLHARITYRNDEYLIEDLGSTNGTFVNNVRILKCVLRNNDQILIGDSKILFFEEKSRQV